MNKKNTIKPQVNNTRNFGNLPDFLFTKNIDKANNRTRMIIVVQSKPVPYDERRGLTKIYKKANIEKMIIPIYPIILDTDLVLTASWFISFISIDALFF